MKKVIGSLERNKFYGEKYKEGFVYLSLEAYEKKEGVCFIPSVVFEELGDGVTVKEIEDSGNKAYTYDDLLELCKGNDESVGFILRHINWVHPETFLDNLSEIEYEFCETCGTIYDLDDTDECPNCGK